MPGFDNFFSDDDAERTKSAETAPTGSASAASGESGHGSAGESRADAQRFHSAFDGEPFPEDSHGAGVGAAGVAAGGVGTAVDSDRVRVRRRRRRQATKRSGWRTALIILLVTVCFLGVSAVVGGYLLLKHWDSNVKRIPDVFPSHLPGVTTPIVRPTKVVASATNILMVGSDSRADQQTTGTGGNSSAASPIGQRSDTMMLVHIDASKHAAWVVSIPRDSWVPIPGHGVNKINAAFSFGGPALMVATVEQLTHVHIDHYAEIDFEGFQAMTDALGGVDVKVSHSFKAFGVTFTQGVMHMDGAQALAFVRDRHNQPGSDFGRINDQHTFLLALIQKISSLSLLTSPLKINTLMDAITSTVSVDDTFSGSKLRDFVWSVRNISPSDVQFLTVPVKGTGMVGDQSVVFLDPANDTGLWDAMINDTMNKWTPPG